MEPRPKLLPGVLGVVSPPGFQRRGQRPAAKAEVVLADVVNLHGSSLGRPPAEVKRYTSTSSSGRVFTGVSERAS